MNKTKIKVIGIKAVLITALLVICLGCQSSPESSKSISGNGIIETKTFSQNNFNAISIDGGWTSDIRYSKTFSIQIETDENLFSYLDISVTGNVLNIGFKSGYSISSTQCKASITMPALIRLQTSGSLTGTVSSFNNPEDEMSIDISGSGDITARDITLKTLQLKISGSGTLAAIGKAQNLKALISGSGDIKTADLETEKAEVSISGSGSAEVWVKQNLKTDISGSGSIRYKGNPAIEPKGSNMGGVYPL